MSQIMLTAAYVGALISCAFPLLILLFGLLAARAGRRGELTPDVRRVGIWVVCTGALSLVLYSVGAFSRQNAPAWAAVGLVVLTAALCGWFLSRSPTRSLKIVSWALFFNTLFVAAFGVFALWIAGEALRVSAYSSTNEAEIRAALAKNPNDAAAHSSLGMIYSRRGDRMRSMAEWRQVLRVEPDNVDALLLVSADLSRAGRIDEARPLFQRLAARHDDFSANARRWLARHGRR